MNTIHHNNMNCPVCLSTDCITKYELYDDRYGYKGIFDLSECKNCGHQYLEEAPKQQMLGDLYTNFYPRKSFDPKSFRPYKEGKKFYNWLVGGRSSACQTVKPQTRVLDIGCGYGETLAYLQNEKSCDAYGVDADRNVEIISKMYGLRIHIGVFDSSIYETDFFDTVIMNQVIEHVPDLHQTFSEISKVLKSGGTCVLSTPNANGWGSRLFGSRWLNWHAPYHQHFLSKESVLQLCKEHGFTLESMETVTRSEWLIYQILHLINYPDQGTPSSFWAPYATKRSVTKKIIQKLIAGTWFLFIPQLISRLFDILDVGDNFLIVIKKT